MKLINLTPHPISIVTDAGKYEIQPSGDEARVETTYNAYQVIEADNGHRIGIETVRYGTIVGLPEPEPDTLYIVSSLIAHHANRRDVVCPGRLIRDIDGSVIGCEGFVVPEIATTTHQQSNTPEILRMSEQGMRQTHIARTLGITPQAVSDALKRHRQNTTFTDTELCLIVDALNGTRHTDGIPYQFHIISNVVDAIEIDYLDDKWNVDREKLSTKLKELTETEAKTMLARVDAFWDNSPHTDMISGLREAGLVR